MYLVWKPVCKYDMQRLKSDYVFCLRERFNEHTISYIC